MRRLPAALLSFVVLPAGVLAAPVVSQAAPAPVPVPSSLQDIALDPVLGLAEIGPGPRTVAALAPRDTGAFSALGVTWAADPHVGAVEVQVRTRSADGWSEWREVEEEESTGLGADGPDSGPDVRDGTAPVWVGDSDGVQARVEVWSGRAPVDLRLSLIDPGESAADAAPGAGPLLGGSVATAATTAPNIHSRAEWGADERLRTAAPTYSKTVQAVAVHHTASSSDYRPEDVPGLLRSFYAFHVQSRGWSDIGYNVLVDRFGTAWEGRFGGPDRAVIGAHAGGFNTDTTGIAMIGTYDAPPPEPMLEAVAQVAAWKLSLYHRDPRGSVGLTSRGSTRYPEGQPVTLPRIFGHRDVSTTSCPGEGGVAALPGLRERVATLIEQAPPPPPPDPAGDYEDAVAKPTGVRVTGWALDPDGSSDTSLAVTLDGRPVDPVLTGRPRADVHAANPPYGVGSGFDAEVPTSAVGPHEVCLLATNQGAGTDTLLGCRTVVVPDGPSTPPTRTAERACPDGRVPGAGFEDVGDNVHAAAIDCIVWWGLARGVSAKQYAPVQPVRRAQMATFLARMVRESGGSLPADPPDAFDDDAGAGEHQLAINQLAAVGISRGKGGRTYDPDGVVTRDQMASFLAAAVEHRTGRPLEEGEDYFADDDRNVHEPGIDKVARAGITGGTASGRYDPGVATNRGQMASFLARVLDLLVEKGDTPPHA